MNLKKSTIENLDPEFVMCRDLLHAWRYFDVIHKKEEKHYEEILRCARCGTLKHRFIGYNGGFAKSSKYTYPAGYVVKGSGRATAETRAKVRIVALQQHQRSVKSKKGNN